MSIGYFENPRNDVIDFLSKIENKDINYNKVLDLGCGSAVFGINLKKKLKLKECEWIGIEQERDLPNAQLNYSLLGECIHQDLSDCLYDLKDDLLILLLAETQKNQGFIEKSLSYYVLLMSEYSESPYMSRAIVEASELLGQMGHTDQQNSMLEALKDSEGTYGILARKKLGIEEPAENEDTADNDNNQLDSDNEDDNQLDSDNEGDNQLDSDNEGNNK